MGDRNIVPGSLVTSTGPCVLWPTFEGSIGQQQGNRFPGKTIGIVLAVKDIVLGDASFRWLFVFLNRTDQTENESFGWVSWASPIKLLSLPRKVPW